MIDRAPFDILVVFSRDHLEFKAGHIFAVYPANFPLPRATNGQPDIERDLFTYIRAGKTVVNELSNQDKEKLNRGQPVLWPFAKYEQAHTRQELDEWENRQAQRIAHAKPKDRDPLKRRLATVLELAKSRKIVTKATTRIVDLRNFASERELKNIHKKGVASPILAEAVGADDMHPSEAGTIHRKKLELNDIPISA